MRALKRTACHTSFFRRESVSELGYFRSIVEARLMSLSFSTLGVVGLSPKHRDG